MPWLVALLLAGGGRPARSACLVALPVLRLRGIYLALCTLAFAILMDGLVFGNSRMLGGGETLAVPRPDDLRFELDQRAGDVRR